LAALLAIVCSGAEAQDRKSEAVPVEAAKVIAAPLSEQVTAIGTLLSDEAVTVSSEIPGRLKEIHFQEGQPVDKGAPLFTRRFGLSGPAGRRRGQAQACRADS
jgi:multidrug efflux pump subunit AcrA (membrane-fusion protein)